MHFKRDDRACRRRSHDFKPALPRGAIDQGACSHHRHHPLPSLIGPPSPFDWIAARGRRWAAVDRFSGWIGSPGIQLPEPTRVDLPGLPRGEVGESEARQLGRFDRHPGQLPLGRLDSDFLVVQVIVIDISCEAEALRSQQRMLVLGPHHGVLPDAPLAECRARHPAGTQPVDLTVGLPPVAGWSLALRRPPHRPGDTDVVFGIGNRQDKGSLVQPVLEEGTPIDLVCEIRRQFGKRDLTVPVPPRLGVGGTFNRVGKRGGKGRCAIRCADIGDFPRSCRRQHPDAIRRRCLDVRRQGHRKSTVGDTDRLGLGRPGHIEHEQDICAGRSLRCQRGDERIDAEPSGVDGADIPV